MHPSHTALLADSAYFDSYERRHRMVIIYLRAPSDSFRVQYSIGPYVHFLHNGVANVLYCDGHVESNSTKYNVIPNTDPNLGDLSPDDSAYNLN